MKKKKGRRDAIPVEDKILRGLLAKSQAITGENYKHVCDCLNISNQTYYRRIKEPGSQPFAHVRFLAQHYGWTDRK